MITKTMSPPPSSRGSRLSLLPRGPQLYYLTPSNLFGSSEPTNVTTIVGSSVAICLWDPVQGVGGINHYLLPRCPDPESASGRFGDSAFELLLNQLIELGASQRSLLARIVGGACMISAFRERDTHLGRQNVEMATALLHRAGIRVVQQETGGNRGRKIVFRTDQGATTIELL